MSGAVSAADADILHGLQEKLRAWDIDGILTDACDHFIDSNFAQVQVFKTDIHASGVGAAGASRERHHARDRRVVHHDLHEL